MGLGFGIVSEIKKAVAELLQPVIERLDGMQATQKQMQATLNANNEMLQYLVAEVSRFKNESNELMVSCFAFCTIHGVSFTYGELFTYGGKATRYSRKHGYRIESVQDPRFGAVNLYEPVVLERVILGFTDDDYK